MGGKQNRQNVPSYKKKEKMSSNDDQKLGMRKTIRHSRPFLILPKQAVAYWTEKEDAIESQTLCTGCYTLKTTQPKNEFHLTTDHWLIIYNLILYSERERERRRCTFFEKFNSSCYSNFFLNLWSKFRQHTHAHTFTGMRHLNVK